MSEMEHACSSETMPNACGTHESCGPDCSDLLNGAPVGTRVIPGAGSLKEWANTQAERDLINIVNADPVEACPRESPFNRAAGSAPINSNICIRNCCEFSAYKNVNFLNGDLVIGDPEYAAAPLEEVCVPGNGLVDNQVATDVFPNLLGVNGNIYIVNTDYVKITGFAKLRYVTGKIVIHGNEELTEMPTFPSLLNVTAKITRADPGTPEDNTTDPVTPASAPVAAFGTDGAIVITYNPVLKRVNGFESVRQVDGGIYVAQNACLRTLCGFIHLYRTPVVYVQGNARLTKITGFCYTSTLNAYLSGAAAFGGLYILDNGANATADLEINAFQNLSYAFKVLIGNNTYLKSLKLDALRVASKFIVRRNPDLRELSTSLQTARQVTVDNNAKLESISFTGLEEVLERLDVNNNGVKVLDTFHELKSVGYGIMISENKHLSQILGFEKIKYIGSRRLANTPTTDATNGIGADPLVPAANDIDIAAFVRTDAVPCTVADVFTPDVYLAGALDNATYQYVINQLFFHHLCNRAICDDAPEAADPQIVNYSVIVYGNDSLHAIAAFASLRHVEANIYIVSNVMLHAIHAFTKLAYALDIWIRNNMRLKHIIGLGCLIAIRDMVVLDTSCLEDLNNIKKLEFAQRLAFEALTYDAIKFSKPLPSVDGFIKYFTFDH